MRNTNTCIQNIENAINKVKEAKNYLNQKEYKSAENSMADNIQFIIDVLNCINGRACQCDGTAAITLTATTDLQNGNKYITPSGAVITWIGDGITVCEPGIPPDIWSVNGAPFTLKDVTGKVQQIPTPNASVPLEDGSFLLVGIDVSNGHISKSRFIMPNYALDAHSYQGYPTNETEIYSNDVNKSKSALGTIYQVFGF